MWHCDSCSSDGNEHHNYGTDHDNDPNLDIVLYDDQYNKVI